MPNFLSIIADTATRATLKSQGKTQAQIDKALRDIQAKRAVDAAKLEKFMTSKLNRGDMVQGSRGEQLGLTGRIVSPGGKYALQLENGNFRLRTGSTVVWQSQTNNARRLLNRGGQFVILDENDRVLATMKPTATHPQAYLAVQDDGNLVVYAPGNKPLWASSTYEHHTTPWGWVAGAVATAGKAVGSIVHEVADVSSSLADLAGKIPFVGPGIKGLYNYTYGAMFATADNIGQGVRLDKVVSRHFESQVNNVKAVAPYVQTVIGLVPGIGPGISAGISAGLSLASGHTIDQALIDAAVGALPGGAMAQMAAKMGIAAAQGKPIDEIAINALPIPDTAKKGAVAALRVMKDVADGKRVDQALLREADKQVEMLPKEMRDAAKVGIALGQGKRMQDIAKDQIPKLVGTGGPLAAIGQTMAKADPILAHGRKIAGQASHGFDVAAGLMKHKINATEFAAARKAISDKDKKGFDMAVSLHTARVVKPVPKPKPGLAAISPGQAAGYYMVQGMGEMTPANKALVAQAVLADPQAKAGAVSGVAVTTKAGIYESGLQLLVHKHDANTAKKTS